MLWNKKDINPPIRELSVAGKTSIKNDITLLHMCVCIAVVVSAMDGSKCYGWDSGRAYNQASRSPDFLWASCRIPYLISFIKSSPQQDAHFTGGVRGLEKSRDLPRVPQLNSGRAGLPVQVCLVLELGSFECATHAWCDYAFFIFKS